jgi:proteasome lid subunit RPN8/RPN11
MELPVTIAAAMFPKTTAMHVITAKKLSAPIARRFAANAIKCIAPAAVQRANCVTNQLVVLAWNAAARAAVWSAPIASPKTFVPNAMKHNLTKKQRKIWKPSIPEKPSLRFSPPAWAKLLYLRDRGPTEVGGFAIAATADPLLVTEVHLIDQNCTAVTVAFDDRAVADFFDEQVDRELRPEQFARIWIHTHPGNSPQSSSVDEETFARVFGQTDWAVMFILACGGRTYARLQFSAGPGGSLLIPARLDFSLPFGGSDEAAWEAEYLAKVHGPPDLWTVPDLTTSDVCSDQPQIQPASHAALLLRAAAGEVHENGAPNECFTREDHWYDF